MFRNVQAPPPPPPPPPTQKSKGKVKASTVIPVVIIIGCIIGAAYFSGFFGDFSHSGILSPTRDIEGTWKTAIPTEFTIATDYDDSVNLKDVGTENRTMTWKITGTGDPNMVIVDITFSVTSRDLQSGSGYTPDVSPMQFTGIVNGTQLTLIKEDSIGPIDQVGTVGAFTFTTSQMQGTWHDHWEGVWEQNVYTATNGLKLMKQ
jgi:hypothetical protein